ncbi:hypothetical protein GCM10007082_05280 [Oceanisphaera arctica]|nr:hypothetical protein GCM10007082_05280 [Oceanisphaera arctica]
MASIKAEPMMPKASVTPLAASVSTRASLGVIRGIAVFLLLCPIGNGKYRHLGVFNPMFGLSRFTFVIIDSGQIATSAAILVVPPGFPSRANRLRQMTLGDLKAIHWGLE